MPELDEQPEPSKPCDPGSYVPDPLNCNAYYRCILGELRKQYCAGGLHWNRNRNVCDWPSEAKCKERKRKHCISSDYLFVCTMVALFQLDKRKQRQRNQIENLRHSLHRQNLQLFGHSLQQNDPQRRHLKTSAKQDSTTPTKTATNFIFVLMELR